MVDSDALARRLLTLSECLTELERPDAADAAALARDSLLRAAVECCFRLPWRLASISRRTWRPLWICIASPTR